MYAFICKLVSDTLLVIQAEVMSWEVTDVTTDVIPG